MSFVALSLYQMSSLFQVLSCCLFCEATINRILWGSPMRFLQWVSEFLSPLSFCPRQFNPHHFPLGPSVPPSSSFLDDDYCYLSFFSLLSLVLVWKERLVYLQLGKTISQLVLLVPPFPTRLGGGEISQRILFLKLSSEKQP